MRSLVSTGPQPLRGQLRDLSTYQLIERAAALRRGTTMGVVSVTKLALRELARRARHPGEQMDRLSAQLGPMVTAAAPALVARHGVGTDTAGALLVAAGDSPERLAHEAAFAHVCGVAPIEASSGKVTRHRLNRGRDLAANNALWRIVMVRMVSDPDTRFYVERRTKEDRSKRDIMRLRESLGHSVSSASSPSTT